MEAPASQIRRICAQDRSRTCQLECFVPNASRSSAGVGVAVPGGWARRAQTAQVARTRRAPYRRGMLRMLLLAVAAIAIIVVVIAIIKALTFLAFIAVLVMLAGLLLGTFRVGRRSARRSRSRM